MVRTVGVEEELILVDPTTGEVSPGSRRVLARYRQRRGSSPGDLDKELFLHQLEIRTEPVTALSEVTAELRRVRRTAGEAAEAAGLAAVASGTVPGLTPDVAVTPDDRYREMVETYGEVARQAGTCGMHVHVAIGSSHEGVAVIDRIAPWLPCLLAISANSPFYDGHDTGYASWRSQLWSRWPSAGPTERFGSVEAYQALQEFLIATGAASDPGMYYLDARLAAEHPTVELRVADVCTDPDDAVLVAGLARGLVETAARSWRAGEAPAEWRAEELRAGHWRAARYGVTETLVHPSLRQLRPAREVLESLVAWVGEALDEAGDRELVDQAVDRVLAAGGATAQRAAYERTGEVRGVVDDLVLRTRASWSQ